MNPNDILPWASLGATVLAMGVQWGWVTGQLADMRRRLEQAELRGPSSVLERLTALETDLRGVRDELRGIRDDLRERARQ